MLDYETSQLEMNAFNVLKIVASRLHAVWLIWWKMSMQ